MASSFSYGHAWTRKSTLALQPRLAGGDDNGIERIGCAGFEQERDFEHDDIAAFAADRVEKGIGFLAHHRMDQRFEFAQPLGLFD